MPAQCDSQGADPKRSKKYWAIIIPRHFIQELKLNALTNNNNHHKTYVVYSHSK